MNSPAGKRRKRNGLVSEPADVEEEMLIITPRKSGRRSKPTARLLAGSGVRRPSERQGSSDEEATTTPVTPIGRRRVQIPLEAILLENNGVEDISTPTKLATTTHRSVVHNADRSARRKSARRLIERDEDNSAEDDLGEEDMLAQLILSEEEDPEVDDEPVSEPEQPQPLQPPETPSKRGRGRPRKPPKPARSPTPPRNLPPHEKYFFDNRPGGNKTSDNTLASVTFPNHEEYYNAIHAWKDPHAAEIEHLHSLHSRSFDQWIFELECDFNICLYGWGSKRALLTSFATHLLNSTDEDADPPSIVIVNGASPTLTLRSILLTIASTIPSLTPSTLPLQPATILPILLPALGAHASRITVILHSLDSPLLRRPTSQSLLATLATHPRIALVASADTPNFPLLWDVAQRARFNFLFHDATTFVPLEVELQGCGGVVDEVNRLLGRSGRRVDGREGVGYVLRSLPENARRLFRLLVEECLALNGADVDVDVDADDDLDAREPRTANDDDDDGRSAPPSDDDAANDFETALSHRKNLAFNPLPPPPPPTTTTSIPYRVLYQKAVQAFIATNEMAFRTLLKEFHDHAMIVTRKDGAGGGLEMLGLPFRREELVGILEDLGVE